MIIVLACDVPLAQNNGAAVAGINLKNALEARGHQVRVLCPGQGPEAPSDGREGAAPDGEKDTVLH